MVGEVSLPLGAALSGEIIKLEYIFIIGDGTNKSWIDFSFFLLPVSYEGSKKRKNYLEEKKYITLVFSFSYNLGEYGWSG